MQLREYLLEGLRGGDIGPPFPCLLTKLEVRGGLLDKSLQGVEILNLGQIRAHSPHCVRQPGCDVDISLRDRIAYCVWQNQERVQPLQLVGPDFQGFVSLLVELLMLLSDRFSVEFGKGAIVKDLGSVERMIWVGLLLLNEPVLAVHQVILEASVPLGIHLFIASSVEEDSVASAIV